MLLLADNPYRDADFLLWQALHLPTGSKVPVTGLLADEKHQSQHTDEPKAAIKTTSVPVTPQQRHRLMASMLQHTGAVICITINIKLLWLSWVEL